MGILTRRALIGWAAVAPLAAALAVRLGIVKPKPPEEYLRFADGSVHKLIRRIDTLGPLPDDIDWEDATDVMGLHAPEYLLDTPETSPFSDDELREMAFNPGRVRGT